MKKMYLLYLGLSLFAAAQSNAMDPDPKSNEENLDPIIGSESTKSSHITKGNSGSEKESKIGESKEGVTTGGEGKGSKNGSHEESKEGGESSISTGSLGRMGQSIAGSTAVTKSNMESYFQNTVTGSPSSTPLGPLGSLGTTQSARHWDLWG